jgi:hypothetical protein
VKKCPQNLVSLILPLPTPSSAPPSCVDAPFRGVLPQEEKGNPKGSRKLVKAFDTRRDPTHLLKRSLTKRGAEATIALAMSHGENVDWLKVISCLDRDEGSKALEMKGFFT